MECRDVENYLEKSGCSFLENSQLLCPDIINNNTQNIKIIYVTIKQYQKIKIITIKNIILIFQMIKSKNKIQMKKNKKRMKIKIKIQIIF